MNKYIISIKVSGFNSFDELKSLNLYPTETHRKGDHYIINKRQKTFVNNFWEYRIELESSDWIQVIINDFIKKFIVTNRESFKKISLIKDVILELYINVNYLKFDRDSFHFEKEDINILGLLGFELDIEFGSVWQWQLQQEKLLLD